MYSVTNVKSRKMRNDPCLLIGFVNRETKLMRTGWQFKHRDVEITVFVIASFVYTPSPPVARFYYLCLHRETEIGIVDPKSPLKFLQSIYLNF